MSIRQPPIQTLEAAEAPQQLAAVLDRVRRRESRVLVEEHGTPIAAIVSAEDLKRFERLERERDADFAIIDELREAFRDVPEEEIERETDRVLAEIRSEGALGTP